MKKVFNFLRSMRFGIILLLLIAACSVVGSVIPQERGAAWYAQNYTTIHPYLLMLGLDHVFRGWFFITLLVLLCLNLMPFAPSLRIPHGGEKRREAGGGEDLPGFPSR